jgi:hypothetical protein
MLEEGMQEVVGDSMPELWLLLDKDLMSPYSDLVLMVVVAAELLLLCRWRWWWGGEKVPLDIS